MEKLRCRPGERNPGNNQNTTQQVNINTRSATSQRQVILAYLLKNGSITTLEARNEMFVMGIAARIWELKHKFGHNIHTVMVPTDFGGTRLIARYVLLGGDHDHS